MNIGTFVCVGVGYFMFAVAYVEGFGDGVFSFINWIWLNKISVAFFVMFLLFLVQVTQIKGSLSEMSQYLKNWDAALTESE